MAAWLFSPPSPAQIQLFSFPDHRMKFKMICKRAFQQHCTMLDEFAQHKETCLIKTSPIKYPMPVALWNLPELVGDLMNLYGCRLCLMLLLCLVILGRVKYEINAKQAYLLRKICLTRYNQVGMQICKIYLDAIWILSNVLKLHELCNKLYNLWNRKRTQSSQDHLILWHLNLEFNDLFSLD